MKSFALIVFSTSLLGMAKAQMDCTGLPDGPQGAGCKAYTCCQGEVGVAVDCPPGCAYNYLIKRCDDIAVVPPPCGDEEDCSELPDGRYPDMSTDCRSFYNCLNGEDLGSQPCNEGLVFSWHLQTCAHPEDVCPPCGTAEGDPCTKQPDFQNYQPRVDECDVYDCPSL